MAGIGMSVMHDVTMELIPRIKTLIIFGFFITFLGGSYINWKIQHNVLHTYTNISSMDEDIESGILDFPPNKNNEAP